MVRKNVLELSVWLALVVHLLCLVATHSLLLLRRTTTLLAVLPSLLFTFQLGHAPN